jgi:DNA repair exonuclease SbcCD nuclease subunit
MHSDLHGQVPDIPLLGDTLVLAGDIDLPNSKNCKLVETLEKYRKSRDAVIYIPGNHEFYGGSREGTLARLNEMIEDMDNVHLGHKLSLPGKPRILATTLWSAVDVKKGQIAAQINDYYQIEDLRKGGLKKALEWHKEELKWLETEIIDSKDDEDIIVFTHHAPLTKGTSPPKYEGGPNDSAFSSDLSDLVQCVRYWGFGHTHHVCRIEHGPHPTVVEANCLGYAHEKTGWKIDHVVDLGSS